MCSSPATSALLRQYRDGPRPAGRGAMNLYGEAHDLETIRRQLFEVVQLLQMRIADLPPGAMALPDEPRVTGLRHLPPGAREGRVPAPAVGADKAHASLQHPQG